MENKNYFLELNKINVNDKVEKKNGLTYLSWAYAWAEVKKLYPDSNYKVYETLEGVNYFTDGRTGWVKTGVIVNGIEHIEYLPIMDYKNKSIPLEQITSFDVNKTIQRSLTKAVARHGLGLYIYAGEDLPEDATKENAENKGVENVKVEIVEPNTKTSKNAKRTSDNTKITTEKFIEAHVEESELPFDTKKEEKAIEDLSELHDTIARLNFQLGKDITKCYEYFCKLFNKKTAEDLEKTELETIIKKLEYNVNKGV